MSDTRTTAATAASQPRPRPFHSAGALDHDRQIETLGRAVDEVVGAFVQITVSEGSPQGADARRLAAAARRLWTLAVELGRERRGPF